VTAGLSAARLARLHDVMAGYVERGELPGLITLVARRGEAHVDVLGSPAFGSSASLRRDAIFRISSMTKPITAAATMLLVEQGKLRLDDPVDGLLPELAGRRVLRRLDGPLDDTVAAQRPVTTRDLLTFRMGMGLIMAAPDAYPILKAAHELGIGMGPPQPASMPAPDEWLRRLGTLPLMYQPGERWMYNTGADVLGVLVARAAGQPFDAFLRNNVFAPLGMDDTAFSVPAADLERFAPAYWSDPTDGAFTVYDEAAGGQWSRPPVFPSGAGGLVSTIDDYLAFAHVLLGKGRRGDTRLLSRPTVELMTTDQLTPAQKSVSGLVPGFFDGHGWGFGMAVVTARDGLANVGSYGWDGGLGTSWWSDPREELTTILLTPCAWASPSPPPVCRDFWTGAYQAIDD
jgi:CubicO group peptidase (beta-lactamase class C family)